jgi:hypothetical protein
VVKRGRAREVAFAVRPVVHQVLSVSLQTGFEWGAFAKEHYSKRFGTNLAPSDGQKYLP